MHLNDAELGIKHIVSQIGDGAMTEAGVVEHIHPLFSRVLARNQQSKEIYLANHSLGRPLDWTSHVIQTALDFWYTELDAAWSYWIDARDRYRAQIARTLHWPDGSGVIPKTSAAQGLRAVLNALPMSHPRVVSSRCEFDSIDFVLKAYAHKGRASLRWVQPDERGMLHADAIIGSVDETTDLVVVSMVCFVTGQVVEEIERVIEHAHCCGAMVLLDAYHAFGVLPIDFASLDADFIIGGNYKYTRGGPGACFLAINPRHLHPKGLVPPPGSLFSIDTGWFAKDEPFAYQRQEEPIFASGGNAWLEATPPVLTYFQALPGLMLTNAIGVARLRAYSVKQQDLLAEALGAHGVRPRLLPHRGAYILIEHEDGPLAIKQLKEAGVNADARPLLASENWAIRLCPDLLNTRDELEEAARRIAHALGTENRRRKLDLD